jgi:hypothetical protein
VDVLINCTEESVAESRPGWPPELITASAPGVPMVVPVPLEQVLGPRGWWWWWRGR